MSRRGTTLAALMLVTGAGLSACTSDTPGADPTPDATTASSSPTSPATGWFCGYLDPDLVETATGGRTSAAVEHLISNDGTTYLCQVELPADDGSTEVALTLSVIADDAPALEALRAEITSREGVVEGPDYLGDSFVSPGQAVAFVPCGTVPGAAVESSQVPFALSLTAGLPAGAGITDDLATPLNRFLQVLDQRVGCSPSKVNGAKESESDSATSTGR